MLKGSIADTRQQVRGTHICVYVPCASLCAVVTLHLTTVVARNHLDTRVIGPKRRRATCVYWCNGVYWC